MLTFDDERTRGFWAEACEALGVDPDARHHIGTFAEPATPDRAPFIDTLAGMARDGAKRGTAHLEIQFERDGIAPRVPGDYWIVTTTGGDPLCVVLITAVLKTPFSDVPAEFAASEGEGDLSLGHWREVHGRYFRRQCERWGVTWSESLTVVCESFEPVYPT